MALTYGKIYYEDGNWIIGEAQPHVCIKLKANFAKLKGTVPFTFKHTPENCQDLLWFLERYPLDISLADRGRMVQQKDIRIRTVNDLERILSPTYQGKMVQLNPGEEARYYQLQVKDFHAKQKRFLLGDDLGLGKTLEAILTFFNPGTLPAVVCVQTHLPRQWAIEGVHRFTNLTTHLIKQTKPYNLPPADVYMMKYSQLNGWIDFFQTGYFKSVIFDEVQELRNIGTQKYTAAEKLCESVEHAMGMSATPIYNYGDEIFNIIDLLCPGALGSRYEFLNEWAIPYGSHHKVKDPPALGAYLRERFLFLRRTRKDVGRELPPVNKIVYTVEYDEQAAKNSEQIARDLAIKATTGLWVERGQAARDLDIFVRHETGVAKAKGVAEFVKILLENDEPVVLAGWHRDVYDIWMQELAEYKPVLYTGSESEVQKNKSKQAFIDGDTNLFIISLRSGIGLDGLQHRCKTVVVGELDWSPKVHEQLVARVDRDGQPDQVTAYFLVCEFGSDPVIIDMLGLKASQAHGIVNPFEAMEEQKRDETRTKKLAEAFLNKIKTKDLVAIDTSTNPAFT